ncbi:MAG: hypothetical protein ACRDAO_01810 [Culicoidibacterales bacterium]
MKFLKVLVFLLCLSALVISMNQFYNLAIFVDEFGTTPSVVLGGPFWLIMTWAEFLILFISTILSGFFIISKK